MSFYYTLYNLQSSLQIHLCHYYYFFLLYYFYNSRYYYLFLKEKNKRNSYLGKIVDETDIFKNGSPLDCSKSENALVINSSSYKNEVDSSYFSYSFWLYVNNNNSLYENNWNNYKYSEWKSIFYAGNTEISSDDLTNVKQFPGFWFSPKLNNIVLLFQTDSNSVERMEIMNVPMNEWFNVVLVVENKSASVYINCKMENNFSLVNSSPSTSDYNLYIAKDAKSNIEKKNGFPGFLANLSYYNYSLNQNQINMICKEYGDKFRNYQSSQNKKIDYTTSCLVTDSDLN